MLKKIYKFTFFLFSALSMALSAQAEDKYVDVFWMVLDETNHTAEIVDQSKHDVGFTTLIIHETYTYNNQVYTVTLLGEKAFNGSDGLTTATIANSIDSIGPKAFGGCVALSDMYVSWPANDLPKVAAEAFDGVNTAIVCLHYPKSALAAYQADPIPSCVQKLCW